MTTQNCHWKRSRGPSTCKLVAKDVHSNPLATDKANGKK